MLADLTALHESFLEGIKKEYSGTVPLVVFAKIWNEWAQPEWVMDNVSMLEGVEITQKQIDDLEPLRRFVQIVGPSPFDLTTLTDKYYRLLSVMFKLNYNGSSAQECGLTGTSDWLEARILRSDMRSYIMKSPYRKPSDSRLYYYIQESKIYMVTDATIGSPMSSIQLEYLTYPDELDTNTTSPGNLHDYQRKEIVERCVEKYLERVRDPRWQTYLQSMNMKGANKI